MKNETDTKNSRQPAATRALKDVPVTEIERDPENRAIDEDDEKFLALVDSIRVFGVLQRLHVYAQSDRFRLIDGERRHRAAIAAGLDAVPCEIWPARASRGDAVAAGIILNDQRQAHSPLHIARRLRDLKNAEGLTGEEVAQRMAMPLDRVKTYFSLFGGSDSLIQFLEEHAVALKVAVELVRFERATNEGRTRKLLQRYLESPLTRRQIAALRQRAAAQASKRNSDAEEPTETRRRMFAGRIERAFERDPDRALAELEEVLSKLGFEISPAAARPSGPGTL